MQQNSPQQPAIVEGAASGAGPDASWRWPEARWRQAVNRVRAGRALRPDTWPGGAQVAVALSFDVDQETLTLRDGKTSRRSWRKANTALAPVCRASCG